VLVMNTRKYKNDVCSIGDCRFNHIRGMFGEFIGSELSTTLKV